MTTTRARSKVRHLPVSRSSVLQAALLLVIHLAGASIAAPRTPAAAAALDGPASSGPKAYVALAHYNEVAIVDTGTHQVLAYIAGLLEAHSLVASPDGRRVYVGTDGVSTVSVIDTSTNTVTAAIRLELDPSGLALSPDGRELLVAQRNADEVVSVDTASNQISRRIAVPQPEQIAISPDGRRAYVVSTDNGAPFLAILDLSTHSRTGRILLDDTPVALHFGSDATRLYLTMPDARGILVLDTETHRMAARIAVPAGARSPVPTQDGRSMLVVSRGALNVVDLRRGAVSGTVTVGTAPSSVAVSRDEHTAYVTNEGSDDVSVVDLDNRTVVGNISVGYGPTEIVLQPRIPQTRLDGPSSGSYANHNAGLVASMLPAALFLPAADAAAAYGPGYVSGVVTQRFTGGRDGDNYEIAVDGVPYDVPRVFWLSVHVGDRVRYAGMQWQIVSRSIDWP